jgi:hypothetical protein
LQRTRRQSLRSFLLAAELDIVRPVWPQGSATPYVSTLNWVALQTIANAAVAPLGIGGGLAVASSAPVSDVIIDVNGYYSSSPADQTRSFGVTNSSLSAPIQATNLSTTCSGPCGVSAIVSSGAAVYGTSATGGDGVYGYSTDGSGAGVHGSLSAPFAGSAAVLGQHTSTTGLVYGVKGSAVSPSGYGVWFSGNLGGTGTKNFVEPHATDPTLVIKYVALEGREAGTFFRGTATTVNREAVIEVPEDFRIVTAEDGLTVQLTPLGQLSMMAVVSEDLYQIVVRSQRDVKFHYLIQGIRRAYSNLQPVTATLEYMPASPDDRMPEGLAEDIKQRLIANGTYNPDGTVNMDTARRVGWTTIWEEQGKAIKAVPSPGSPAVSKSEPLHRQAPTGSVAEK